MNSQSTLLSGLPYEHPSLDYEALRQEGIKHLEQMAGRIWTDFNTHDPGITILEQLCYAITDLAHRIEYDLPDLLSENGRFPFMDLPGPGRILTSAPVNPNDWRKLLIDIAGVKNAWIIPAVSDPLYFDPSNRTLSHTAGDKIRIESVQLAGLHQVSVALDKVGQAERGRVEREIRERLHAHRALCEDFSTVRILSVEDIFVDARVEIRAVDDAETVLLSIYQKLAEHISPTIHFSSLQEMLAAGYTIDQIFDGPLLSHGFIESQQLAQSQKPVSLRTSDLVQDMMDVPAVRAVRHIRLRTGGESVEWVLALNPEQAPRFSLDSDIQFIRNGLPVNVNQKQVAGRFNQWLTEQALGSTAAYDPVQLSLPTGRNRYVGKYYSIQKQFPATYGIGELGLPASASPQREAQAKQLQAYLLFFDQLLANYFSQLAHVPDLFAFSAETHRSYFAQMIDDPALGIDDLYVRASTAFASRLEEITESANTGPERRNRFLNHLLARFAEQFTDYALILYGSPADSDARINATLLADKQAFLRDYARISSRRGTAVNYLREESPDNCAGLERLLLAKLGINKEEERFFIVEHILLRPMAGDDAQSHALLANVTHKDPYSLQLSIVFPKWPTRYANPAFRKFVERTVREETPAHLVPTIHWLDREGFSLFRDIYTDWIKRRSYWMRNASGKEVSNES